VREHHSFTQAIASMMSLLSFNEGPALAVFLLKYSVRILFGARGIARSEAEINMKQNIYNPHERSNFPSYYAG
jgi:hypothetical protein